MSAGASEENVAAAAIHNLLKSEMSVNLIMNIILTTIGITHNQDTIHLIFFPLQQVVLVLQYILLVCHLDDNSLPLSS